MTQQHPTIAVIGLGYVGLPLAVEFAKKYKTVGFDINTQRVQALKKAEDITLEVPEAALSAVLVPHPEALFQATEGFLPTSDVMDLQQANVYIITVPTPIDKNNRPNLTPLIKASETVGRVLKSGDTVVYESTVYPGATEEVCVPILEKESGLAFNVDFVVGYSPERINPGDKKHTVSKILKVTSGSTPKAADAIDLLYQSVITAGTYKAPSIKVAEAAKVIENSQRDINIAFVNELAKIFNRLDIDTHEVLKAASTKWNFLPFTPGLVGGHCIGVDPYYLAQKAQEVGYHPEIILAGRRMNDAMGQYVANELIKKMLHNNITIKDANILLLGVTFKENCPDVRNTRVVDVVEELQSFGIQVHVYDPWAEPEEVLNEYGLKTSKQCPETKFDAIVLAVAHQQFLELDLELLKKPHAIVYDVKGVLGDKATHKL